MNDSPHRDVIAALGEAADHAGEPPAEFVENAQRIGTRRLRRRRLAGLATGVAVLVVAVGIWQWIPRGADRLNSVQPAASDSSSSVAPRRCGPVPKPAQGEQRRFEVSATFPAAAGGGTLLRVDVRLKTLYGPSAVARTGRTGQVLLVRDGSAVTQSVFTTEPGVTIELVPGRTLSLSRGISLVQCRDPGKTISTAKDVRPLPSGRYELYVVMDLDFVDDNGRSTGYSSAVGGPWPVTIT